MNAIVTFFVTGFERIYGAFVEKKSIVCCATRNRDYIYIFCTRRDYTLKLLLSIFIVMKLTKTKFIDRSAQHIVELEGKHLEDRQTVLN